MPDHSPLIILGRNVCCSVSSAWWVMASMAPWVSSGHRLNAMLAEVSISCTAKPTHHGIPPPPKSSSKAMPFQPASTNLR